MSAQVGGRLLELLVAEGDRVDSRPDRSPGSTPPTSQLALRRASADRDQAAAQLSLLEAGSRAGGHPPGRGPGEGRRGRRRPARGTTSPPPRPTSTRFETLLKANSGSQKQRDDAATRRDVSRARLQAARGARARRPGGAGSGSTAAPRPAGDRRGPRAAWRPPTPRSRRSNRTSRTRPSSRRSPASSPQKLADAGEILAPRAPIVNVVDLDHAWANIYIDEPLVPRLRLGQAATVFTDAGGAGIGAP